MFANQKTTKNHQFFLRSKYSKRFRVSCKILCILCAFSLFSNILTAEEKQTSGSLWGFETGKRNDWLSWGLSKGVTSIVKRTDADSHSGKYSLLITENYDKVNPYVISREKFQANVGDSLVFSAWVKNVQNKSQTIKVTCRAQRPNGSFFAFDTKKITISPEWTKFTLNIVIKNKNRSSFKIAIYPVPARRKLSGTAEFYLDDIRLAPNKPIDLRGVVNRGFKDEKAGDYKGGWTDQGANDLRKMKPGNMIIGNIPFKIINPSKNNDKSAIILKNTDKTFWLKQATIPANLKFRYLNILSTGAWAKLKDKSQVVLQYADNSSQVVKVKIGKELNDWWGGFVSDACSQTVKGNSQKGEVYLYAASLKNPYPDKIVKNIVLKSFSNKKAIWAVLALTASSEPINIELVQMTNIDVSNWIPFSLRNFKTSPNALLNLSYLLDAPAGKYGFVKSRNGHFVFENGTRVRFWGTNISAYFPTKEQAERVTDTWARLGINIVRFHLMESRGLGNQLISKQKWDRFDYFVKCIKEKGIYIMLGSVAGVSFVRLKAGNNVVDYDKFKKLPKKWAYFSKELMLYSKKYMKAILTHKNHYTGKSLLEEPAVAMLMLINEQTMFTKSDMSKYYSDLLTKMFNAFLLEKYGSRENLVQAWGEKFLTPDECPVKGTIKRLDWKQARKGNSLKNTDTIIFYKKVQHEYNQNMLSYLKSLGCKVPVAGSNFIYSPASLDVQDKMDYTSQNSYYNHNGNAGKKNHKFNKNIPFTTVNPLKTSMFEPRITPTKVNNLPVTSTEMSIMWPNEWRSGFFLSLVSTALLQDWDAPFCFSYFGGWGHGWDYADKVKGIYQNTFNDPAFTGILPAASLMFHRQDIAKAKNLIQIEFSAEDALNSKPILLEAKFPWNYLTFVSKGEIVFGKADKSAQLVIGNSKDCDFKCNLFALKEGDVSRLDKMLKKRHILKPQYGLQDGKLISDTGEVERNWKTALLKIDSPKAQGFTGFPKGKIKFKNIEIKSETPYATIIVCSMDNNRISESKKLLICAVGRVRNTGETRNYKRLATAPSGYTYGTGLILYSPKGQGESGHVIVEPIKAIVTIAGHKAEVTPLKANMTAMKTYTINAKPKGKIDIKLAKPGNSSIWYIVDILK